MLTHSYLSLAARLSTLVSPHPVLIIGIDGPAGSGKSAFAASLLRAMIEIDQIASLIHFDDFALPKAQRKSSSGAGGASSHIGDDFDWERLRDQVLAPLQHKQPARFHRYDWKTDAVGEAMTVPAGDAMLIEGLTCTRRELFDYYDFCIWVDAPTELRLQRGLARDGEGARAQWEQVWMPAEQRYIAMDDPRSRADLLIDCSGQFPCHPRVFVGG